MSLELLSGEARAVISLQGGWLERLEIAGEALLYPRQELQANDGSQKVRGGCHVCLPNFGPGGETGLAQHGFGRTLPWSIEQQTASLSTLALTNVPSGYEGLAARLQYTLSDEGIRMELTAQNDSPQAMRLAPGFHPYFATAGAETVLVDGQSHNTADLGEAILLDVSPTKLSADDKRWMVQSENLRQWVLWTDGLGDYVCLEPTQAGPSFEHEPTAEEVIAPGESRQWALEIKVS